MFPESTGSSRSRCHVLDPSSYGENGITTGRGSSSGTTSENQQQSNFFGDKILQAMILGKKLLESRTAIMFPESAGSSLLDSCSYGENGITTGRSSSSSTILENQRQTNQQHFNRVCSIA